MNEKEIMEKIKNSSENIEIPEELLPENVQIRLSGHVVENGNNLKNQKTGKFGRINFIFRRKLIAVVSVVIVVAAASTLGIVMLSRENEEAVATKIADNDKTQEGIIVSSTDKAPVKKMSIGNQYVIAGNYENVRESLKKFIKNRSYAKGECYDYDATDIVVESKEFAASEMDSSYDTVNNGMAEYSQTNVQTEGIDESDIVKTDGKYIYSISKDGVNIADIQTDDINMAGRIKIDISGKEGLKEIKEMYVSDNKLNVVVQTVKADLDEEEEKTYDTDIQCFTSVMTYDITDRANPELIGEVKQDGTYYTSRKSGDIIYLFTNNDLADADISDDISEAIPEVNGEDISADNIYLSEDSANALVISSLNINKPDKIIDNVMILNHERIYMGNKYLYLYSMYTENTVISRFSMEEGIINGDTCGQVEGSITDTFAINEYNGKLRVATLNWAKKNNDTENCVFVMNDNMEIVGSLRNLAMGEEIRSARFMGDTLYLVTYENTDPLFVIDLSDEKNPIVCSELKITGFSSYLHKWNDNVLLGLGYETDPDDGRGLGLKLSAFDVSDMSYPKVLDTVLWTNRANDEYNHVDTGALSGYDSYKCILADAKANLFGFTIENYGKNRGVKYVLFSLNNGKFECLLEADLEKNISSYNIRGVYAGNRFYVVTESGIQSYNMENGYQLVDNREF